MERVRHLRVHLVLMREVAPPSLTIGRCEQHVRNPFDLYALGTHNEK